MQYSTANTAIKIITANIENTAKTAKKIINIEQNRNLLKNHKNKASRS